MTTFLRTVVLLALLVCLGPGGVAPMAFAQPKAAAEKEKPKVPTSEELDAWSSKVQTLLEEPTTQIDQLQAEREDLVRARNVALDAQANGQSSLDDLKARLDTLGPAPTDGATESPEITDRRASLEKQLNDAKVPILQAQEAVLRANGLIADLDRKLIQEFSENLVTRGPAPVLPRHWRETVEAISQASNEHLAVAQKALENEAFREALITKLPLRLLLLIVAVAVTFTVRMRLSNWIEKRLSVATRPRSVAWILALRNMNRIVLPTVGVGLLFAALRPEAWFADQPEVRFFAVPDFAWYLIGAGWLGGSLFAPRTANYRILPIDNVEARAGARLVMYLGVLLAFDSIIGSMIGIWRLTAAAQAVLYFPIIVLGAIQLLAAASLIRLIRRRISERVSGLGADAQTVGIGLHVLDLFGRLTKFAAAAAPALAACGFLAAARLLEFPLMQTIGLGGAALVVFDLISKTAVSLFSQQHDNESGPPNGGLIPVFVAILVFFACLPILGLIWGARPTDIAEAWRILSDGIVVGGVTLSPGVIVKFLLSFGIILGLTRLLQTVLRGTVLPRTRLDAGGRNAVIAGVNYIGFAIAAILGISAAGLDLTNLAIVAGALSVGIGFGLQTVVSNFVSGIILLIERPIKEGDWIEVGEFSGYVRGIRVRSTEIETFDRAAVIVPNADLVAGTVLNRTHSDMTGRLIVPVGVSYDSDPRQVERILLDIIEGHPLVLEDPAPSVLFMEFGADSMNFELRCRLRDVNFMLTVKSDVNFEIASRFRKEGISIPFPQRDVHITSADGLGELVQAAAAEAARAAVRAPEGRAAEDPAS